MVLRWLRRSPEEQRTLQARLGYRFSDAELLWRALTHRSHAHEKDAADVGADYERLEFLGDALLDFVVSDWLFRDDPQASEGVLTRRRQTVVQTGTLAEASRRLGLGELFRLGRGEERTGGREKPSLLADTFEAVVGAIYIDGGLRPASAFIQRHLADDLKRATAATEAIDDHKTRLQERIQAQLRRAPRYRIVNTSGPAHALEFEVEVLVDGDALARGRGTNRKGAEQEAARAALEALERDERTDES